MHNIDMYVSLTSSKVDKLIALGTRLRVAMGEDIVDRNSYFGGEFRVPTYRGYAESLEHNMWTVIKVSPR